MVKALTDNNPNQYSAQGFPALDYLLFGLGENNFEIWISILQTKMIIQH